jgi:hypothetical protein
VDRGVVDEHVELVHVAPQRVDGSLVGDVEPHGAQAVAHGVRIAGAGEHRVATGGELARDLESEAAVGAGHKSGGHGPIVRFERRAPLTAARLPKRSPGLRGADERLGGARQLEDHICVSGR